MEQKRLQSSLPAVNEQSMAASLLQRFPSPTAALSAPRVRDTGAGMEQMPSVLPGEEDVSRAMSALSVSRPAPLGPLPAATGNLDAVFSGTSPIGSPLQAMRGSALSSPRYPLLFVGQGAAKSVSGSTSAVVTAAIAGATAQSAAPSGLRALLQSAAAGLGATCTPAVPTPVLQHDLSVAAQAQQQADTGGVLSADPPRDVAEAEPAAKPAHAEEHVFAATNGAGLRVPSTPSGGSGSVSPGDFGMLAGRPGDSPSTTPGSPAQHVLRRASIAIPQSSPRGDVGLLGSSPGPPSPRARERRSSVPYVKRDMAFYMSSDMPF